MTNTSIDTPWDELPIRDQLVCIWWDLYKDVHGVRPRGVDTSGWTVEDLQHQLANLESMLREDHG